MLPDLFRHALTLNMEIVAMVAEEIQTRAESYVQTHSDEAYETFLNQIIDGVEKTVDLVAAPVETVMQQLQGLRPNSETPSQLTLNWNEALSTLQGRIQDLRKNLQA